MNEQTVELLVRQIGELLEQYGVRNWTEYFKEMEQELAVARKKDVDWRWRELVLELKELYGGMGSFNDYSITSSHGDRISRLDEAKANSTLSQLRHQLADAIREEIDKYGI